MIWWVKIKNKNNKTGWLRLENKSDYGFSFDEEIEGLDGCG